MKADFLKICDEMISGLKWSRDSQSYENCNKEVQLILYAQAISIWEAVRDRAEKSL